MARWAALALIVGFGLAAELAARPPLTGLDAAVGFGLVGLGFACDARRRGAAGVLLIGAGAAWFAGSVFTAAAYLHRGPLAHLLATYPAARLWPSSPWERAVVAAAYAYACAYPVADTPAATIALAAVVVAAAVA